jgi:hypothetical protein
VLVVLLEVAEISTEEMVAFQVLMVWNLLEVAEAVEPYLLVHQVVLAEVAAEPLQTLVVLVILQALAQAKEILEELLLLLVAEEAEAVVVQVQAVPTQLVMVVLAVLEQQTLIQDHL